MGIRYVTGSYDGGEDKTVMVCSTDGRAFGPLFEDEEAADDFCRFVRGATGRDPRALSVPDLDRLYGLWLTPRLAVAS